MENTIIKGLAGEEAAASFLRENGYEILHRNWRNGRYELDIVARKGDTIHFVEVKLRKKGGLTTPEESITRSKFRSLFKAAELYIALYKIDLEIQFDLIAAKADQHYINIRYIPNAMTHRW